jgi:hypothetical protein
VDATADGAVVVSGGFFDSLAVSTGTETVRFTSEGSEDGYVIRFAPPR